MASGLKVIVGDSVGNGLGLSDGTSKEGLESGSVLLHPE